MSRVRIPSPAPPFPSCSARPNPPSLRRHLDARQQPSTGIRSCGAQSHVTRPNVRCKNGPVDDEPGTTLTLDDLILRPWRPADAPAVFAICQDPEIARWVTIPQPFGRADAEAFIETARADVARWHGRGVRHRRRRHRSAARRGDPVRPGWTPGHVRALARTRGSRSRRGRPLAPPGGGLDVRHDRGHPIGRVHHGRQRGVGPDGGACRVPPGGRGPSLGPASRRRASRLHRLLTHPRATDSIRGPLPPVSDSPERSRSSISQA